MWVFICMCSLVYKIYLVKSLEEMVFENVNGILENLDFVRNKM